MLLERYMRLSRPLGSAQILLCAGGGICCRYHGEKECRPACFWVVFLAGAAAFSWSSGTLSARPVDSTLGR